MDTEPTTSQTSDQQLSSSEKTDSTPNQEIMPSNLTLIEEIAEFRTELESKLFEEGLPRDQWSNAYTDTFAKHPTLLPYKNFFRKALETTALSHDKVNQFWNVHRIHKGETKNGLLTIADAKMSKDIFYAIFEEFPSTEVEAIKGIITLRLMVNQDDFIKLGTKYQHSAAEMSGSQGFARYFNNLGFSIIVINKNNATPDDILKTIDHEAEHAKYHILNSTRFHFRASSNFERMKDIQSTFDSNLHQKVQKWEAQTSPGENDSKKEVLAYFIEIGLYDSWIPEHKIAIDRYLKSVKKVLMSNYHSTHKRDNTEGFNDKKYLNNTNKGLNAIVRLYELYVKKGLGEKAARMAINVLDQIPLHKWPALVRILERKSD